MIENTANNDGFGPENLPYGVDNEGRVVVAFGDKVIDLGALIAQEPIARRAVFSQASSGDPDIFCSGSLNGFMALGPRAWAEVRDLLKRRVSDLPERVLRPMEDVDLRMPFEVSDYVDFYSCEAHVRAMSHLLRPNDDPLPPAWRYLPIGYHGRCSTVVSNGAAVARPAGMVAGTDGPRYQPSRCLDLEVELGFVVGVGNERGEPIQGVRAEEHVFGVVLVNDWSARDIQSFEYRPLGPFLGKSFATSVSSWVVPLEALRPWRVEGPPQDPQPASYLRVREPRGLDVKLELFLNGTLVSSSSSACLYWSMAQQLAHITVNGAATRTGDLFATGTISGGESHSAGSLMELASNGNEPILLDDGTTRAWLEDGDEVVIRGFCGERGQAGWISLGELRGRVVASLGRVVTNGPATSMEKDAATT